MRVRARVRVLTTGWARPPTLVWLSEALTAGWQARHLSTRRHVGYLAMRLSISERQPAETVNSDRPTAHSCPVMSCHMNKAPCSQYLTGLVDICRPWRNRVHPVHPVLPLHPGRCHPRYLRSSQDTCDGNGPARPGGLAAVGGVAAQEGGGMDGGGSCWVGGRPGGVRRR